MAKKIVNIRLRPDQEERINAPAEKSAGDEDSTKYCREFRAVPALLALYE
jgi:hypothetical protein